MTANVKKALDNFRDEIKAEVLEEMKRLATYGITRLIRYSPVKSGTYAASQRIGIGRIDNTISSIADPPNNSEIPNEAIKPAARMREIAKLSGLKPFVNVHLSNNLFYALSLEVGTSDQAPAGVFGLVFAELKRIK